MLSELDGIYPMTFYSGPEGVRVKVSPLFFFLLLCSEFPELCSVTKPKLGLSLGTKVKILLHHTVVIDFHCVRVELEDIDQERLDIDVFWLFLFINSSPRLTLYIHIVAVTATIDKQNPHAKLLCLNISNEVEISSF